MKIRNVLIFDDHPLVCVAIKSLIENMFSGSRVFTSSVYEISLSILKSEKIDLIILDVNLSDCDGFDFLNRIRSHDYKGKVIYYSAEENLMYSRLAFRAGADGYVCKTEKYEILKDAIVAVFEGYSFFKFRSDMDGLNGLPALSRRESSVMRLLLQGKTNRNIGEVLSISEKTVSTYKRRIMDKFDVDSVVDLERINNIQEGK